jgi:hypothetical protein
MPTQGNEAPSVGANDHSSFSTLPEPLEPGPREPIPHCIQVEALIRLQNGPHPIATANMRKAMDTMNMIPCSGRVQRIHLG